MRTFIAIPISESCRQALSQMQQQLRDSVSGKVQVRWTSIASIHLTLKFLGEVVPDIIPRMAKSLRTAARDIDPIDLRFSGLGSFPNRKSPRIIWCGIQGDMNELARLQKAVEAVCNEFGFPAESRPFHPHLTLGRVRDRMNLHLLSECIDNGSNLECNLRADHYNIYKSVLKPQGAVYTVIETIKLNTQVLDLD